jgi:hypothetical protein
MSRQAAKLALRDRLLEDLRVQKVLNPEWTLMEVKAKVAAAHGITPRWLNMVVNLTPHWSGAQGKEQRKAEREKLNEELTAVGQRPRCRPGNGQ